MSAFLPEEPVYRLVQSPGIYVLGAALGGSVGLLLAALRMPVPGLAVAGVSLAYALVRLRGRTEVLATRRAVYVRGTLGEEKVRYGELRAVRLEKDLWSTDLVIERAEGKPLRVRDVRDAAGAVAVLSSLARAARHQVPVRHAARAPPSAEEVAAVRAKIARKQAVHPVDLSFLDHRGG